MISVERDQGWTFRGNLPGRQDRNALVAHFLGGYGLVVGGKQPSIPPGGQDMIQHLGHLFILQVAQGGHDGVVRAALHFDGAGHAVEHDPDEMTSPSGLEQTNRVAGERRGQSGQGPAIGSVTAGAQLCVDLLSAPGLKL